MAQPVSQADLSDEAEQAGLAGADRPETTVATAATAAGGLDISALMRSCRWAIEEERLHELRVPLSNGIPAFVEMPVATEDIFSQGNQPGQMPLNDDGVERFSVGAPDLFVGRQVDFIILLPGLSSDAPAALNQALAGTEDLYHDVVGAARLGLHIIGDRDCCLETGGLCAALSGFAEDAPSFDANGELIVDEFEIKFDNAFGNKQAEAPLNPWPALRQMLIDAGYPFQSNVSEGGLQLAVRLVSPLGGRYNIEIVAPLEAIRGDHELEAERDHDRIMMERGYHVVRLTPTEILEKNNGADPDNYD